ncbi:RNA polymerase sigma factor [Bacteroidota bacterium]
MDIKTKQEKFLDLLDPHRDSLYMYARAIEKNREDAEDLCSETILTCYEYFHKLKDESSFKAYLFKVARHKFRRKIRRSQKFDKYDEKTAENLVSNDTQPDLPADIKILYEALELLPVKQKEAVVLFEISGFLIKEISEIQGGTMSAVKSRIKRGREKLTEILCPEKKFDVKDNDTKNKMKFNAKVLS